MASTLTKTRGTILRTWNLGEADRILEIQTDELGLVRAVARGVRKIRSKLAGHLEPFTDVELMLASGRGDLMTVTGAKAIELHQQLRTDLDRMTAAAAIAELLGKLSPDGQVSRRFPPLLRDAIGAIDTADDPTFARTYYEWQIIRTSGWEPELGRCVSCGRELDPERLAFSFRHGGTICRECRLEDPEAVETTADVIKLLRLFGDRSWEQITGLGISEEAKLGTVRLVDHLIHSTLEREPRSKQVGRQLES
jgi:DNA repair protein RecO (recombination protein O)